MASSLATQGFDLKDISIDENSVTAIIQDVTEVPPDKQVVDYKRKRIIHSSQFVYVVWSHFSLEKITVKHLDRKGNLRCIITGKGDDCEAISNEEIPFEELLNRIVFTLES